MKKIVGLSCSTWLKRIVAENKKNSENLIYWKKSWKLKKTRVSLFRRIMTRFRICAYQKMRGARMLFTAPTTTRILCALARFIIIAALGTHRATARLVIFPFSIINCVEYKFLSWPTVILRSRWIERMTCNNCKKEESSFQCAACNRTRYCSR